MIMNGEMEKMWKEAVLADFMLSYKWPGGTE
jgi:hypothetical protein